MVEMAEGYPLVVRAVARVAVDPFEQPTSHISVEVGVGIWDTVLADAERV